MDKVTKVDSAEQMQAASEIKNERLQTIEDRIREKRRPTIENLIRQVEERPGYHTMHWYKSIFSRDPEIIEWRKVVREAIRTGAIRQDNAGRFWPATGPFPYFGEYTLQFLRAWIKPALWFSAFVINFHVTAHYGEDMISRYGFLGHACMAAGVCLGLVIALMFWRAVDDRPY
jgi:hypothetical protein